MKLLKHVCHDECENLVEETIMNIDKMTRDVQFYATPFEQTCADKVVRKLEAQILGCCARSCHYSGKSCLAWPSCHQGREGRLVGGCSEWNVLSDSPREAMRTSVLTPAQARLAWAGVRTELSQEGVSL